MRGGAGGATVAGDALRDLAIGFTPQKEANIIATVGDGEMEKDVNQILEDELLDKYDRPAVRKNIQSVFLAVFSEICQKIDQLSKYMGANVNDSLMDNLKQSLLSTMKLNPAIESLKKMCQERNVNDPPEYDIMNLITGII